ncbi:hypothetical protein [Arthrobacter sp. HS15c]
MSIALVLGAFGVLLAAGVLWASGPLLHRARDRDAGEHGHTAVEYWSIYS